VTLRLLELFSGTGTLSAIARKRGWETLTIDNDPKCEPDICDNVSRLLFPHIETFAPDVIWASPPCEAFSVASIGTHWGGGWREYQPKTEKAKQALALITGLRNMIEDLDPPLWYIENPRGVMRKVEKYGTIVNPNTDIVLRHSVTYCQYGEERMKPTDIWTNDLYWRPRPMCKNGDPCHVRAPRGAKTGTQGRSTYLDRSKLPEELCNEILDSAESQL
jgi:hypothetical protein